MAAGFRQAAAAALGVSLLFPALAAVAQVSGSAARWGQQGTTCAAPAGEARPWMNPAYTPECRARFALRQFRTVDEKFRYLDGPMAAAEAQNEGAGNRAPDKVRDVAAVLGLPQAGAADGPAGVTRGVTATAFPSPIAIAATFDPAAAQRYGDLIGREFHAAGVGTMLGPALDMARSWRFGRLSESFGEDPFLTGEIATAEIAAIQANHVVATMKHYAAYAQEAGRVGDGPSGARPTVNNMVSERALREIYLPGFEQAVKRAKAGAVMCSFPRINGVYACENPHLLDILKREWGFDGTVGPDFPSAQRSITRAFLAGLDSGSFRASPFNAGVADEKPLRLAFDDGDVPEARIDDMILRRLIPAFRVGLIDNPPSKNGDDVSTAETRAAAAELLAQGSVLLKNDKGILPFGRNVRSVAVIGVQATDRAVVVEQGSPHVTPAHLVAPLDAIRRRGGAAMRVDFAPGTTGLSPLPPPSPSLFRTAGGQPGFTADYFGNPNRDFAGTPLASRTVERPYLDKVPDGIALPANNQWSVRYTSTLMPDRGGLHRFSLHGAGSARLFVGGILRGEFELADFSNAIFANVPLKAGQPVAVRIDYTPRSALGVVRREMFGMNMGLTLEVGHASPDTLIADAVRAARAADVAVVFGGELVGEGMDRTSLSLQNDQDALIDAVARANPRTVVVLSTGGPVKMPWLAKVGAVIETWLPGDAFGTAIAAMLYGDVEPGGRLPVTFPVDETQGPATRPHQFPGTRDPQTGELDTAYFDEGVFIGYRYWDQHAQAPLFPFGHGIGYARFDVSQGSAVSDGAGGAIVRVTVRNVSQRAGAEVIQAYLGMPAAAGAPPRQLKGFQRVNLRPGQSRTVEIRLPREAFRHWDEGSSAWTVRSGAYRLMVGRSSRAIDWTGTITLN